MGLNDSASPLLVALDGPAASGKGTLARALAKALALAYLDTGATYRAVARAVLEAGSDPQDEATAVRFAQEITKTLIFEALADQSLRTEAVSQAASQVSVFPGVRTALGALQRRFAQNPPMGFAGAVLEGRDIGTVICPEAPVKIFVTATPEIRAARRHKELQSRGIPSTYDAVLADLRQRDARDQGREAAPLKPAPDAVILDTSAMTEAEALSAALDVVRRKAPRFLP